MKKLSSILTLICLLVSQILLAQDFDNIIAGTCDSLAKKIVATQKKTIAITDFINIDESITQLGTFLSEEVS